VLKPWKFTQTATTQIYKKRTIRQIISAIQNQAVKTKHFSDGLFNVFYAKYWPPLELKIGVFAGV
jgi:hypothetical protein